ncbi:hypothetical protein NEIRO03_1626 [Nematocida sp. AWRm78]|nr:hypothetical protein NEIRO02_1942 [Nematocida sp. AWRm79]KAI5184170.1 hypothetical protein NEIRO03_1626 [Nematocida sp. AWRm78]
MKIFSILLLQCKNKVCGYSGYLIPNGCTVTRTERQMVPEEIEFMQAQIDTICSMDLATSEFILPIILNGVKQNNTIDGLSEESLFYTAEELQRILDENSIESALDQTRISDLFTVLFCTEVNDGALVCAQCQRHYPLTNGIVDFVTAPTNTEE